MRYTVPDYYKSFECIASDCPATCCAGWQIVIDDESLKKYRACRTPFGNRLANSIDWEEQTFLQYAGRCAFLDERNLCDIYSEAGPAMLCRTCQSYPRHTEEFENEREISLSLSCPVVARMVLDRTEKVTFVSRETREEEQDEEFEEFLYFMLQDCRSLMFEILQNRELPVRLRMAMILALAHDVQNRIDGRRMFEIETVLQRYQREGAAAAFAGKLKKCGYLNSDPDMEGKRGLFDLLDELEVLDPSWPGQVKIYRKRLFGKGEQEYQQLWEQYKEQMTWREIETEQLMVYFLFTYFCGAVYDGDAFAKAKMAVVSTLLIQEMELAAMAGLEEGVDFTLEDRARIAWRFSRELEHSDQNLERMEELMNEADEAEFEALLACI